MPIQNQIRGESRSRLPCALRAALAAALSAALAGCTIGGSARRVGTGASAAPLSAAEDHYPACSRSVSDMRENARNLDGTGMRIDAGTAAAALGTIVGALSGDDLLDHVRGRTPSAARGSTAGFLVTEETQARAAPDRFALYSRTIDADRRILDRALAWGRAANSCYGRELERLSSGGDGGTGREAASGRIREIRAGVDEAARLIRRHGEVAEANVQTYWSIASAEDLRTENRMARSQLERLKAMTSSMKAARSSAAGLAVILDATLSLCDEALRKLRAGLAGAARAAPPVPADPA